MNNVLIFGGTFDPIHLGHLRLAAKVQKQFQFHKFIFLPCKIPVLKAAASASSEHRCRMLELALSEMSIAHAEIDTRELDRSSPSYMSITLESYREELGKNTAINLMLGRDSFYQLPQWHQWTKILKLANLLIVNRALDIQPSQQIADLLNKHQTSHANDLLKHSSGLIYLFDAGHYELSSTIIRRKLSSNQSIPTDMIPDDVEQYILKNQLYGLKS